MSGAPRLYTIPAGLPFLDALAAGLAERSGAEALANARVLLPTRRACRALADAFLRQGGGAPLLLPAMTPLGDVDEDDLAFTELGADLDIPPAISGTRRQMLLTRLVLALESGHATPDQAARLAAGRPRGSLADHPEIHEDPHPELACRARGRRLHRARRPTQPIVRGPGLCLAP
jgi:ATP-dependent helicase/nuclease subunit B